MGFLTYHNCSDLPILALRECFGPKKYLFILVKKKGGRTAGKASPNFTEKIVKWSLKGFLIRSQTKIAA